MESTKSANNLNTEEKKMKKYNLSAIMKDAWEHYKAQTGDNKKTFGYFLHWAWVDAKYALIEAAKKVAEKAKEVIVKGWNITQLEKAGASRWTKYGKDRMYLRKIGNKVMDVVINYRRNGGIESILFKGTDIGDGYARDIMSTYDNAYIDLKTGDICGYNENQFTGEFLANLNAYRA